MTNQISNNAHVHQLLLLDTMFNIMARAAAYAKLLCFVVNEDITTKGIH